MTLREKFTSLPVAGYLSDSDLVQLDTDGFDLDTFHSIPLAGVLTSDQVLRLSPVLRRVADVLHSQPRSGPVSPDELMLLVT